MNVGKNYICIKEYKDILKFTIFEIMKINNNGSLTVYNYRHGSGNISTERLNSNYIDYGLYLRKQKLNKLFK